jgi:plasmid maintenance system killer protein
LYYDNIHLKGVWVNIEFATNRLSRAGLSLALSTRLFGAPIGRKYIQRLALIRAADAFNQLYGLHALRLHSLRGDRAGQHAMTLSGNYRLIIERVGKDTVRILGVEDYHGN